MDISLPLYAVRFLKKWLLFFSPALFLCAAAAAQVKFSAVCDARKLSKEDYLQVHFTVENAASVQEIVPPSFSNFSIVSGPNQESSMINDNGKVKQTVSIGFVLKPLSTGSFTIGPGTAKADGKEYRSDPINIEVNNSPPTHKSAGNSPASPFGNLTLDFSTAPVMHQFDDYILRKGENVQEKIKKNLFIRIDVSKTSCYIGEPVVATYKLYTRLKSESNVLKTPSFNGFSVSELEMPDNNGVRTEKYNGREYNVYILRRVQLYPLQSGTLSLEPVQVENRVTFLKAEYAGKRNGDFSYDMLRDFANESAPGEALQQENITVSCNPLDIEVKPLPDAKPSTFKGAVGNFKISAVLEKNNITTDDAGNLKIIISGEGNMPMVNAPVIQWPPGMEGYEPKSSENVDKFSIPIKGEKIFNYPFTAGHSGIFEIPAIEFSYFDPSSGSYKTIFTPSLSVNVDRGTGNKNSIISGQDKKTANNFYETLYKYRWYIIGGWVLIFGAVVLFVRNRKQKEKKIFRETIEKKTEEKIIEEKVNDPLKDAETALLGNNTRQFYRTLDDGMKKYLSQKLKIPLDELTHKRINEAMDKCNVSVGTTLLVNSLLENIELNLYASASAAQMQEDYEKAREVVSLLDKQIC